VSRSLEDSVVNSELSRWGFWCGLQYAADGYSPTSTLSQIFCGRSERPGHRILVIDPPERSKFWQINARILMLRRELYEVLVARYCLPVKSTGHPYYPSELATFLGITAHVYAERLALARRTYQGILFPDLVLINAAC
jgi:hypothetical protein